MNDATETPSTAGLTEPADSHASADVSPSPADVSPARRPRGTRVGHLKTDAIMETAYLYQPDDLHMVIVPVTSFFSRRYEIVRREDYEAGLIIPAYRFESRGLGDGRDGRLDLLDDDNESYGYSTVRPSGRGRISCFDGEEDRVCELRLQGLTEGGEGPIEQIRFPAHPTWNLRYFHAFPHWRYFDEDRPLADCGTFTLHRSLFLPTTRRGLAVSIEVHDTTHYLDLMGCAFALYRAFL